MNAATDFANGRVRAAADLDWATCAIELTGSIKNDVGFGDVCAGVLERTPVAAQRVALRAAVPATVFRDCRQSGGQKNSNAPLIYGSVSEAAEAGRLSRRQW